MVLEGVERPVEVSKLQVIGSIDFSFQLAQLCSQKSRVAPIASFSASLDSKLCDTYFLTIWTDSFTGDDKV